MANLLKVASLWTGEDKEGNPMMTGIVSAPVGLILDSDSRVVILTNKRKEAQNQPDFDMYITKSEPKDG